MAEPAAHASLGPSGSKRWLACPGSVVLSQPFPDTSSTYSDDGTAMHIVAAWCLTEHWPARKRIADLIPVHHAESGEKPRYVEFSDEMAVLVQEYVDTVRLLGIGSKTWIEKRVDLSEDLGVADQFGTADAIILDDRAGELMLIDLKTGYKPVSVEANSQLMLYALGALRAVVNGELGDGVTESGVDEAADQAADAEPDALGSGSLETAEDPAEEKAGDDDDLF